MRMRHWALVTTALTVLSGTTSAGTVLAQTATASSDEVIVTGIRKSLQSSVKVKKNTDAVVDVISAEDVGKFPDTNVAESLSHLPGVSVDRNFGEGEKVSILGTDPALNRILVDGHTIASADWGGNPNDPTSRTFNYSLLAPEIIGQARVYKGPEAWIDEGSLGGTVIIDTRKPLDLKSGTLNASLGYSYNDRSEKGDVRGSVLYSWHNEAKNFGILVAATYDKEQLHRAGIEYFGYSGGDSFDGAFTKTRDSNNKVIAVTGPNINGAAPTVASYNDLMAARVPCCFNWAYFDQDRERTGLSAAVQWKPADNAEINLTALHINGDYTNYNQSMYSVPVWNSSNASDLHVANGIVTHGVIPAKAPGQGTLTQYDAILRNTIVKTDSVNIAGKWTGDKWKISANGGFTRATGGKEPERMISFNANSGFTFDFGPDHTTINFDQDPKQAGQFFRSPDTTMTLNGVPGTYVQLGGKEQSTTTDRELYAQVDFSRELNGDFFKKVLFGFKASAHSNELDAVGYDYFTNKTAYLSDFNSQLTPENLFADMGGSGNAMQYLGLTRQGVLEAVNSSIMRFNGPKYDMEFKVRENIEAAYIQGNFSHGALHGNAGLRLVDTSDESTYWNSNDNGKTYQPITVTHKSLDPLPAVNLVYDVSDDVLLKFGVAKVIARPRYSQLAGAFSLDNTALTGGGGNPDLKPYKSTNFEGSAEWYFGKTGMLTGEVFYRDIASYVVSVTNDETHFNTATNSNATYFITRPVNAQNAKVTGMSVQFQKDIALGFGVIANYTYAEADTGGSYNMPYLSKNTFNVIPYYEAGPAQIRLSWSSRSKYFTGIGRRNSVDFADGYTQVDLSASYKLNDHLSFYANGQNLLDETYYSFSSVTVAPTAFYKNGRRFMIGVNYKM